MAKRVTLPDVIPLYPDEETIALLVLGPSRAKEWKAVAVILEREGLPRIDTFMGGRYWPAVRAFFDSKHGLGNLEARPVSSRIRIVPFAPDGPEEPYAESPRAVGRRRPRTAST